MEEGQTARPERWLQTVGAVALSGARQCPETVLVVTKRGDIGTEWAEAANTAQHPTTHNAALRAQVGRAEAENLPGVKGEPRPEGGEACGGIQTCLPGSRRVTVTQQSGRCPDTWSRRSAHQHPPFSNLLLITSWLPHICF